MASRAANLTLNKCQPILVQGLRRDIEINFHVNYIYGSVAQWISAWLWIWRTPIRFSIRGIFSLKFLFLRGNEPNCEEQQQEQQLK